MKFRLKHPIRAIREPFGTAGLIVAMIALVAALGGTALAAAKLNSTQKKEVEKIAKKVSKPGPAGPQGNPGAPGAAGKDGTNGTNGTNGAPGTAGESVTVTPIASPGCNGQAGAKFKNATGEAKACNGAPGTTGFTETLPTGKTEKGTWGAAGVPSKVVGGFIEAVYAPISFVIPLATAPTPIVVGLEEVEPGVFEPEPTPAGCLGNVENPGAEKGNLCAFVGAPLLTENFGPSPVFDPATGTEGAGTAGALLLLLPKTAEKAVAASGTWAVTAP